jgi:hypothetical protein
MTRLGYGRHITSTSTIAPEGVMPTSGGVRDVGNTLPLQSVARRGNSEDGAPTNPGGCAVLTSRDC